MLMITLRDLQLRARRVLLGLAATALVLAMTVLLDVVHDSFLDETDRAVGFFGADTWVVPADSAGPFTTNSPIAVGAMPVDDGAVTPVAIFRHVVQGAGPGFTDVNVIGYRPGGVVVPQLTAGTAPNGLDEVAVDETLGVRPGRRITLAGRTLTVVGTVRGLTYNGGTPTVLVTLDLAQRIAYDGKDLASAFVVRGRPSAVADGMTTMTPRQVRDDLRRPLAVATTTLAVLSVMLWCVAAAIVAFLSYLSGLDRTRDLAVFKAVGASTGRLVAGLVLESVGVAIVAGTVAILLALLLLPLFPLTVELSLGVAVATLAVAVVIGLLASIASAGRAIRVDPVLALGSS